MATLALELRMEISAFSIAFALVTFIAGLAARDLWPRFLAAKDRRALPPPAAYGRKRLTSKRRTHR